MHVPGRDWAKVVICVADEKPSRGTETNGRSQRKLQGTWPVVRQESAHRRIPDVVRDVQSLLISELL